jgi:hypothetical protein
MEPLYYTVERVCSPCGIRKSMLFQLTYRREWRPELGQWCDFLVSQVELSLVAEV